MDTIHKGKGFFLIPVIRMLSFFMIRMHVKAMIEGVRPAVKISETMIDDAAKILAVHNGFLAEIQARLWIFKGETFQVYNSVYTDVFESYFLPDLGLLQILFSIQPKSISTYINNFGTDDTLMQYLSTFDLEVLKKQTKLDYEKICLLIQGFLRRLI